MEKSEFKTIGIINNLIKEQLNSSDNIGIGDDTAVIRDIVNIDTLITTDILVENVHFNLSYYSFYNVGYKAAIVNISDIIVKGGKPHSLFISIAIPKDKTLENITNFYNGLIDVCKMYNVSILGGDTTSSNRDFFVSITAIGTVEKNKAILRSGAKVGDNVYVLGVLGESDLGLKKLLAHSRNYKDDTIQTHLSPKLFASTYYEIIKKHVVSSSLDVSDGLLKDLSHIAEMSNVCIEVEQNSNWELVNREYKNNKSDEILNSILSGGEDYAFAFTSRDNIEERDNLIKVGQVVDRERYNNKIVLLDKDKNVIEKTYKGFEHF